jgi:transcriptional regulator with XRE-family HTH domain
VTRDARTFIVNDPVRVSFEQEMNKKGLSIRAVSRQMNVSHATIVRFLQGEPVDPETIIAVANWLGVPPATALNVRGVGEDALAAKIALIIEQKPDLAALFTEALDRVLAGRMSTDEFRELASYAAYRFGIKPGENVEATSTNPNETAVDRQSGSMGKSKSYSM